MRQALQTVIALTGCILCGSALANGGPRPQLVEINAAFDGYVIATPVIGESYVGSSGLSSWRNLSDNASCQSSSLDTSAFSNPKLSLPEKEGSIPAVQMFSPILEKQIAEAIQSVEAFQRSLARVENAVAEQQALDSAQDSLETLRNTYEQIYVQTKRNAAWDTPDSADGMSKPQATRLLNTYAELSAKEREFLLRTQARYRDFNLVNMREDATRNLASAECSLAILRLTKELSDVYCPFDCEVLEVHVGTGQWVTKGDRLITITNTE